MTDAISRHAIWPLRNASTATSLAALIQAGFAENTFFRGSREPVYLKGQLPPITVVGAVKD